MSGEMTTDQELRLTGLPRRSDAFVDVLATVEDHPDFFGDEDMVEDRILQILEAERDKGDMELAEYKR